MLEKYQFIVSDGNENNEPRLLTIEEILEEYEIKGLNLEELQEKYVNMVDEYEEKIDDMSDKYEELNENILNLEESIHGTSVETSIEDDSNFNEKLREKNAEISNLWIMFTFILVIGLTIAYNIGKSKK